MLQEAGLGAKLKPTAPIPTQKPSHFWKKIPPAAYAVLGASALLITLLEGYPWLSVEEGSLLDPTNPFSELFSVSNGGYIPLAHLDATCAFNFDTVKPHTTVIFDTGAGFLYPDFADYLSHGGRVTLPCFHTFDVKGRGVASGARLDVTISYAFYGANLTFLRRSQNFHFKSIVGTDNAQHWEFLQ
jgi:hypothetical protein